MLSILNELVEKRIAEASARGEFQDLPGRGRPLVLDDDRLVPETLRVAYRVLKNSGHVPPEVVAVRELGELLACASDERVHAQSSRAGSDTGSSACAHRRARRLMAVSLALEQRGVNLAAPAWDMYRSAALARLSGEGGTGDRADDIRSRGAAAT
ncbi:MAG: DUF1992 domain-containing protein [Burkholderiaceae bacterium]|nr:DUF1992 domain-containing protein [Burkholderiaceae bacterium]